MMIEPLSCTWALDHLAIDLPGVSSDLLDELRQAALAAGSRRLALVGGAVRDGLLHRQQHRTWTASPIWIWWWKETLPPWHPH